MKKETKGDFLLGRTNKYIIAWMTVLTPQNPARMSRGSVFILFLIVFQKKTNVLNDLLLRKDDLHKVVTSALSAAFLIHTGIALLQKGDGVHSRTPQAGARGTAK